MGFSKPERFLVQLYHFNNIQGVNYPVHLRYEGSNQQSMGIFCSQNYHRC